VGAIVQPDPNGLRLIGRNHDINAFHEAWDRVQSLHELNRSSCKQEAWLLKSIHGDKVDECRLGSSWEGNSAEGSTPGLGLRVPQFVPVHQECRPCHP
jgi:hypothetical protein